MIFAPAALLLIFAIFLLLRAKDLFVAIQPLKIINFYALPLFLLGFLAKNFSILLAIKTILAITLLIAATHALIYHILKAARERNIHPDA